MACSRHAGRYNGSLFGGAIHSCHLFWWIWGWWVLLLLPNININININVNININNGNNKFFFWSCDSIGASSFRCCRGRGDGGSCFGIGYGCFFFFLCYRCVVFYLYVVAVLQFKFDFNPIVFQSPSVAHDACGDGNRAVKFGGDGSWIPTFFFVFVFVFSRCFVSVVSLVLHVVECVRRRGIVRILPSVRIGRGVPVEVEARTRSGRQWSRVAAGGG